MLLDSWSIALLLTSGLGIILLATAARTAVNVLRWWNPAADDNRQIRLENETWLAATLVQYALVFQITTLVLFVMAADRFSGVIVGAMCATGSLTANAYGIPLLLLKMADVFLYGFWIVLHQLDISSEDYPLLKIKYGFLLVLLPLMVAETVLTFLYLAGLTPDIITSCCAVVFGGNAQSAGLMGSGPRAWILKVFYPLAAFLVLAGVAQMLRRRAVVDALAGLGWAAFLPFSLIAITTVFSSYIYAMPYHLCPFCILKPEYHYIGYLIYFTLLPAVFFGGAGPLATLCRRPGLEESVAVFRRRAVILSLVLLVIHVVTVSWPYASYMWLGGQ